MAQWSPKGTMRSNQAVQTSRLQGDVGSFQVGGIRQPRANLGIMMAIPDLAQQQVPSQALAQIAQPQGGYAARPASAMPGIGTPPSTMNRSLQVAPQGQRLSPYATLPTGYAQQGGGGGGQGETETFSAPLTSTDTGNPEPGEEFVWSGPASEHPYNAPSATTPSATTPISADTAGIINPASGEEIEFRDAYDQASSSIDESVNQQRQKALSEARRMGYGPGMLAQISADADIELRRQKQALWFDYIQAWWDKEARDRGLDIQQQLANQGDAQASSVMQSAHSMSDRIEETYGADARRRYDQLVADATDQYMKDHDIEAYDNAIAAAYGAVSTTSERSDMPDNGEMRDMYHRAREAGQTIQEYMTDAGYNEDVIFKTAFELRRLGYPVRF